MQEKQSVVVNLEWTRSNASGFVFSFTFPTLKAFGSDAKRINRLIPEGSRRADVAAAAGWLLPAEAEQKAGGGLQRDRPDIMALVESSKEAENNSNLKWFSLLSFATVGNQWHYFF
jgi:hypothetical protein